MFYVCLLQFHDCFVIVGVFCLDLSRRASMFLAILDVCLLEFHDLLVIVGRFFWICREAQLCF